jgi:hypothetical protein
VSTKCHYLAWIQFGTLQRAVPPIAGHYLFQVLTYQFV